MKELKTTRENLLFANIDDYEIKDFIGIGDFGSVFRAINTKTNQEFAFKNFITCSFFTDHEFLQRVAISKFPGFIKIHGYRFPLTIEERKTVKTLIITYDYKNKKCKINVTGYIAFSEFMKNGDISTITDDYLKKGKDVGAKMNPTIRSKIIFGVAAIMKHAHKMGVILRDLSMRQIFLDDNFEPLINPLILSMFITYDVEVTKSCCPPYFIAPESYMDGDDYYNFHVDVYAYAFVLYKMFSTSIEFEARKIRSGQQFMMRIDRGMRPKKPENIPDHYWELIQKCWDHDPSNRPSFEEITNILKDDKFALEEFGMKTDLQQLHEYQQRIDTD